MNENAPELPRNRQLFESRPSRTFGAAVQFSANTEVQLATTTNWSQTCQSLQEKIAMLTVEVSTLRKQNIEYTRRDESQGMKIWKLEAEVEWLRHENESLWNSQLNSPSTSSSNPPHKKARRTFIDLCFNDN